LPGTRENTHACSQGVCLCSAQDNLQRAGYLNPPESYGVFYAGDGKQLGIQLLGAASIMLWSTALSAIALFALRYFKLLRLHVSEELTGGCLVLA
jgi:ammonia channel protein AmtB